MALAEGLHLKRIIYIQQANICTQNLSQSSLKLTFWDGKLLTCSLMVGKGAQEYDDPKCHSINCCLK